MVRISRSETVYPLMSRLVGVILFFGILSCMAVDADASKQDCVEEWGRYVA